jgi:hypothetical protein
MQLRRGQQLPAHLADPQQRGAAPIARPIPVEPAIEDGEPS